MKFLVVILVLAIFLSIGLLGVISSRRNLEFQLSRSISFEKMKVKVSSDVLTELQSNIAEATIRLGQTGKEQENLTSAFNAIQEAAGAKKAELNACSSDLSNLKSEIDTLEEKKRKAETEFQQQKDSLMNQVNNLKQELQNRSKVCDFISNGSTEGMKLCGIEPPVKVEQKPEPAKAAK